MAPERTLNNIKTGESAVVKQLMMHGTMRRRLLDIGLTEGARVECIGRSPAGDPAAYLIRGAVIAIRDADTRDIIIQEENAAWDSPQAQQD